MHKPFINNALYQMLSSLFDIFQENTLKKAFD
jgi:hypothetical protein